MVTAPRLIPKQLTLDHFVYVGELGKRDLASFPFPVAFSREIKAEHRLQNEPGCFGNRGTSECSQMSKLKWKSWLYTGAFIIVLVATSRKFEENLTTRENCRSFFSRSSIFLASLSSARGKRIGISNDVLEPQRTLIICLKISICWRWLSSK